MKLDMGKCEICGRRASVVAKIGEDVTHYTREFGRRDRRVCQSCCRILLDAIGDELFRLQFGGRYVT